MTNRELVKKLLEVPLDAEVVGVCMFENDYGYTYLTDPDVVDYGDGSIGLLFGHYDSAPEPETKNKYPCDSVDENGHSYCPYADCYTGYEAEMCRVCCGLGVDD